jgi:hypothetical protein
MKTKCYATLNRFGFPLLSRKGSPFIACTDRCGAWQHEDIGEHCTNGKRHCVHHEHVPEKGEAPQAAALSEAPPKPLALFPSKSVSSPAQ